MSNDLATVSNNELSTINEATIDDTLKVITAVNSATSLNDYINENGADIIINVTDIFTMPGVRKGRGAGQTDTACHNTYLITTDGECLMTQSDGIYRSAAVIVTAFPTLDLGNDEEGFPVRVVSRKLKNGNTLKTLVPVK